LRIGCLQQRLRDDGSQDDAGDLTLLEHHAAPRGIVLQAAGAVIDDGDNRQLPEAAISV